MSNANEMTDLDDPFEEGAEDHTDEAGLTPANPSAKAKPADSKDARRRLDDLLESQRIKHQIDDDF